MIGHMKMKVSRKKFIGGVSALAVVGYGKGALAERPACPQKREGDRVEDPELLQGLRDQFTAECCEVGMYLAMSRQATREGNPAVADAFRRYAYDEAGHAARFAELLGEVVTPHTKKNLELRKDAEQGACAGKLAIARRAKELGYDAIHDTVHEMAKDEARHGCGFERLLKKYFG